MPYYPQVRLEVPSYKRAKELTVKLSISGENGLALTHALKAEEVASKSPESEHTTATVRPFALMSEEDYAKWVAELLRSKLSEHWPYRW